MYIEPHDKVFIWFYIYSTTSANVIVNIVWCDVILYIVKVLFLVPQEEVLDVVLYIVLVLYIVSHVEGV